MEKLRSTLQVTGVVVPVAQARGSEDLARRAVTITHKIRGPDPLRPNLLLPPPAKHSGGSRRYPDQCVAQSVTRSGARPGMGGPSSPKSAGRES